MTRRLFVGIGAMALPATALGGWSASRQEDSTGTDRILEYLRADALRNMALAKEPDLRPRAFRALGANVETMMVYVFARTNLKAELQDVQKRLQDERASYVADEAWAALPPLRARVRDQGFEMPDLKYGDLLAAGDHVRRVGLPRFERMRNGVFEYFADKAERAPRIQKVQLDPLLQPCAYGLWDQCPLPADCEWLVTAMADTTVVIALLALVGAVPAAEMLGIVVSIMGSIYAHFCQAAT